MQNEEVSDQSFDDENDSVGQEYSINLSSSEQKVLPNSSTSDHMQNLNKNNKHAIIQPKSASYGLPKVSMMRQMRRSPTSTDQD